MTANRDRMVAEFIELAKIASLSKAERAVAEAVQHKLAEIGLEVSYDDAGEAIGGDCGNLIAVLPATDEQLPTVMFNAHLDTVSPGENIEPVVDGDRIYSAGETIVAADDKSGVVAVLEALRIIAASDMRHGGIEAVFTVAEEIGLFGAKHLSYERLRAKMAYVLDGGDEAGVITVGAPYSNSIEFTVRGKAAHAGVCPEKGVNAIQVAGRALAAMNLGRIDDETTANIGVIEGGEAPNIVPARCRMRGEARSHKEEKLRAQTSHMVEAVQQAARDAGAQVEIKIERCYNGFRLTEDDPVVALAMRAARELGTEPKLHIGGGGSDANIFNEHGIPAVILASGAGEVHTTNEYVNIPVMVQAAEWLARIISLLPEVASSGA